LGDAWDVSDGTRAVDLDGRDATFSGIQQTFATEIGQTYSVTFDLSGNPEGGPLLKQLQVSVGDFSQDYSFDSSGQTLDALIWQTVTFSFVALDTTSTLAFTSLSSTPSSFGPLVDNVSVTAVPEPATVLLMAAASSFLFRRAAVKGRG
jgi:choice-of-anchor C domain-containing protein